MTVLLFRGCHMHTYTRPAQTISVNEPMHANYQKHARAANAYVRLTLIHFSSYVLISSVVTSSTASLLSIFKTDTVLCTHPRIAHYHLLTRKRSCAALAATTSPPFAVCATCLQHDASKLPLSEAARRWTRLCKFEANPKSRECS